MITEFIESPGMLPLLEEAKKLKSSGKRFSDVEDAAGNQYVDLVQEGGGVLGIALVGYTCVLEHAGIRFFSLAGTSAGAINTMLIAGLKPLGEPVSENIVELLANKDLFDFVDGDIRIKRLIQKAVEKEKGIGFSLALNAIRIYNILKNRLGLNPGRNFESWLAGELYKSGISTWKELSERRKLLPAGLNYMPDPSDNRFDARLAIITADITTHSKVEFPKMAALYWKETESVSPARFVRASMSIPFFFEPFQVRNIPDAGMTKHPKWIEYMNYLGEVPPEVRFVDGGMLSNFPINVFHRTDNKPPRMPTFGVRLSAYRDSYSNTGTIPGMSGAMISTMRQIHDYDFLLKNPDYNKLICMIDADREFNWLNFNMSRKEQVSLFTLGAQKALAFLNKFDWEEYKKIRNSKAGSL